MSDDGRVDLADDGVCYPSAGDVSIIRSVILARIAEYRHDDTDLFVDFDPDETEFGGGDPQWARAIAEDVANRWDS